ncbi:MAG: DUF4276 family protein [Saprospiraceae bacterium]|nr:MAG: DUF4276 family protein [Saprospiraceae bacterium]
MNKMQVEILVEERSMEFFLRGVLPSLLPEGISLDENCFIRAHEGKQHLQKEIPPKVRAYQHYSIPTKVIIIQDQDSSDCKEVKQKLAALVNENSTLPSLVRIACRELEAWYLGDMDALEKAYPHFKAERHRNRAKFRDPDTCNASDELRKIIPDFQKSTAARRMPSEMDFSKNRSGSFQHLVKGLKSFLSQ